MTTRARPPRLSSTPPAAALATMLLLLSACASPGASPDAAPAADQTAPEAPSATESASATPTPSPSTTPEPNATSTAGPGQPIGPPELAVGDWVATRVEGLRLREEPGTGGTLIGMLRSGFSGTVIEGPVEADGFEWVYVAWPGLPAESGCATGPDADGFLSFCGADGWLATADDLGNPWVERIEPDCPPAPTTVRDLSQVQPGLALACFGGQQLSLIGYLAPESEGRGCMPSYRVEPEWFHPCAQFFIDGGEARFDGTNRFIAARVHPSLGEPCGLGWQSSGSCPLLPYADGWVRVTGQYDHPDAATCVGLPVPDMGEPPSAGRIVYECRLSFTVTAIERASAP